MRFALLTAAGSLALTACSRDETPGASAPAALRDGAFPARRAGLWEQTSTQDGRAGRLGVVRMCIDAATDSKLSIVGQNIDKAMCRRTVDRLPDGVWRFTSMCDMGRLGVMSSRGSASGDFASRYIVHAQNEISGSSLPSLNGRHEVRVDVRYIGPCPPPMAPGDVAGANGVKVNLGRFADVARALGVGA
ncbi:MAG: DUF3617 family protein [Caulobacteraceae bacterium]